MKKGILVSKNQEFYSDLKCNDIFVTKTSCFFKISLKFSIFYALYGPFQEKKIHLSE
jgi:hypothetical protein